MNHMVRGILVLLLGLSVAADGDERQDKPATPAQQYEALLKEHQDVPEALAKATTDDDRKQVLKRLQTLPLRFLELAEKNSQDPVALDALIQRQMERRPADVLPHRFQGRDCEQVGG